ncbi:hypothetical protein IGS67_10795 [Flavimobilis sp. GY10621]|uniref:Uncharacterized protein n=1 Tax=Flavimobilis rhizosphaerae TaxID=2775421 RepID=A0ABR9DSS3_9MICO|nr:hypothetical protein [Flavimobilis rhizosphaerae]MBD9699974.1 hypothetical protein [Flavimobilis rhizosphaerae]
MKTFTKRAATTLATLALAASGALVATVPAHAAPATFTGASISGLKSKYATSTATYPGRSYSFTVDVAGSADDGSYTDITGDGVGAWYQTYDPKAVKGSHVVKVKTRVSQVSLPRIENPSKVTTGKNTYKLVVNRYTTPGVYELRIPITQRSYDPATREYTDTVRYATKRVTINASTKVSFSDSSFRNYGWTVGKTATFYVTTPAYQHGAKVTLYYKKKGAKKYSKITSKTLKAKKGSYSARAELKTKKLTKAGHLYFKVSGVAYAPGYKTPKIKVTVKRR